MTTTWPCGGRGVISGPAVTGVIQAGELRRQVERLGGGHVQRGGQADAPGELGQVRGADPGLDPRPGRRRHRPVAEDGEREPGALRDRHRLLERARIEAEAGVKRGPREAGLPPRGRMRPRPVGLHRQQQPACGHRVTSPGSGQ
jgi:hypothetical protein